MCVCVCVTQYAQGLCENVRASTGGCMFPSAHPSMQTLTHEGMFVATMHVDAYLRNRRSVFNISILFFSSYVRKQVVIIKTQMVGRAFWHREAGRQRGPVMLQKLK